MKPVTFDIVAMQYLQLFERFAGAPAKDCIAQENKHLDAVQEQLLFVVDERDIGKAIGRQGANVKKLEQAFRKKVRIIAFSDDPCTFIQNLIAPHRVKGIACENGVVTIEGGDTQSKALLIGRDRRRVNQLKDIARRYFHIEDIKII